MSLQEKMKNIATIILASTLALTSSLDAKELEILPESCATLYAQNQTKENLEVSGSLSITYMENNARLKIAQGIYLSYSHASTNMNNLQQRLTDTKALVDFAIKNNKKIKIDVNDQNQQIELVNVEGIVISYRSSYQ